MKVFLNYETLKQTEIIRKNSYLLELFVFFNWEGSCNEVEIFQIEFQTFQQKYQNSTDRVSIRTTEIIGLLGPIRIIENYPIGLSSLIPTS